DATCVAMHDLRKRLCAQAFCVTAGHAFNLPSDLSVTCHASILTTDAKPRCCIRLSGAPLQGVLVAPIERDAEPKQSRNRARERTLRRIGMALKRKCNDGGNPKRSRKPLKANADPAN